MPYRGDDLGIVEKDQYMYLMTYSFPCQDLSLAGSQKGMAKGSGTRSGLLWEVERLLKECSELPDILLMENVPAVIGKKNIDDFNQWTDFLESIGYQNYVQVLNATDYGVAQNRRRCFMVSVLGDMIYRFPEPIPLERTIDDYLEDEVDECFYINTNAAKKLILEYQTREKNDSVLKVVGDISKNQFGDKGRVFDTAGCAPAILATHHKDPPKIIKSDIKK